MLGICQLNTGKINDFVPAIAKATQGLWMRGKFVLFQSSGQLLNKNYLKRNQFEYEFEYMLSKNKVCQAF